MKNQRRLLLTLADMLAFMVAVGLAYALSPMVSAWFSPTEPWAVETSTLYQQLIIFGLLSLGSILYFGQDGHYSWRAPFWHQVRSLVIVSLVGLILNGYVNYALKTPVTRAWVVLFWMLSPFLIMAMRLLARRLLQKMRHWNIPTYLIGGPETLSELIFTFNAEPYLTYEFMHITLLNATPAQIKKFRQSCLLDKNIPISQDMPALPARGFMIIGPDNIDMRDFQDLTQKLEQSGLPYAFCPVAHGLPVHALSIQRFFGSNTVLLEPKQRLQNFSMKFLKRGIDITGATVGIITFGLPMLILAAKIRQDGGPALFKQGRLGQNGKIFTCWKFRSMKVNAESELQALLDENPVLAQQYKKYKKLPYDPRVTSVGQLIRKYSLDELPQFFNVLQGNMSLVGPRPLLPGEKDDYGQHIKYYEAVKPGITGLWQTSGRNELTFEDRAIMDKAYVSQWSVWQDLTILLKTVGVVLAKKGAH